MTKTGEFRSKGTTNKSWISIELVGIGDKGGPCMEIGIDTLFEHPERPSSAIDYLKGLVRWLPAVGPEHFYYVFVSPRNQHQFTNLQSNVRLVNCFVSNENMPLRIAIQQSILPSYMRRLGLDVLFSPGNVCPLWGRFHRVLKINTLHHYRIPQLVGRTRSLYRNVAFAKSARRADHIVANTATTKEEICRLIGVPEEKVSVVLEASYDFYAPIRQDEIASVRARRGVHANYVLFVSTLYRYKNLETLIRSFAKLIRERSFGCELVVAGRDCDSYQAKLEALAESLGVTSKIRFLGFVPPEDLAALYSGARVFVYPSLEETFGKPLIEAMSCGVPVVASNTSCIPEVLGGAGILVDPLDVDEMSHAIHEASTNELARPQLIKMGLQRAHCFSWEASAKQTLAVIENTVYGES